MTDRIEGDVDALDLGACLGCGKRMHAGDHYYPDVSGDVMCAACAPTYQELINAPEGFVDLETEEPSNPEDLRAAFDAHIAAGGKATDSLATGVLE